MRNNWATCNDCPPDKAYALTKEHWEEWKQIAHPIMGCYHGICFLMLDHNEEHGKHFDDLLKESITNDASRCPPTNQ